MLEDAQPYVGPERRQWVRRSTDAPPGLDQAIMRLAAFRKTWETGDQIDQYSKLTADDLDLILGQLNWSEGEPGVTRFGGE